MRTHGHDTYFKPPFLSEGLPTCLFLRHPLAFNMAISCVSVAVAGQALHWTLEQCLQPLLLN